MSATTIMDVDPPPLPQTRSRWSRLWAYPSLTVGVTLFTLILLAIIVGPMLITYGPDTLDLTAILQPPFTAHHLLGTDQLGRDELTRLLYAGRTDLKVGVLAVIFPFCFGTTVGTVAGFYGGWLDAIVMRIVDVLVAFPFYVLVIGLVFVVGTGTKGIYVSAARVGGLSDLRILARHVLPNTITQAIVYSMTDVVLVIVAIVTLGYLGLGVQPPTPDWGTMISDGQSFITSNWELSTIPGIAVAVTGLSLSLIGDGLADLLRPR
jgi:peptide/nickel transport system permease protein